MSLAPEPSSGPFACELPPRPYPGLRPFLKEEWPIFFGRERMMDEVIERLVRDRFLVVHGDSGCGKSSLVAAGVLPRLEQEAARGGFRWATSSACPGDEPLRNVALALVALKTDANDEALVIELRRALNFGREGAQVAAKLLRRSSDDHVCLLVDQFEELFAHAKRSGPNEASLLVEFLLGIQEKRAEGMYAVLTMRSEFLGVCAQFQGFAEAVNATQYLLPRMEHGDLVRAIREPATLYGGEVERDLAERLIDDGGRSQDQLPLIQHGLMLLHRDYVERGQRADDGSWRLELRHYTGVERDLSDLLSSHADEVMQRATEKWRPDPSQARVVEDVFRALTDINAEGQAVRRPQKLGHLAAVARSDEAALRGVVNEFSADGVSLLRRYGSRGPTSSADSLSPDDRIDISHEALIRCWKKVADPQRGWLIREFKNGLVWRSLLVQAESFERSPSNVLSPATTDERTRWLRRRSEAWAERYGGGWDRVQKLIAASVAERKRSEDAMLEKLRREGQAKLDLKAKTRKIRLLTGAVILFLTLAVAAVVSGVYAVSTQRQHALALRDAEQAWRDAQASLASAKLADQDGLRAQEKAEQVIDALLVTRETLTEKIAEVPGNSKLHQTLVQMQRSLAEVSTVQPAAVRPRVYVHISDESQREAAGVWAARIRKERLGAESIVVPGIEVRKFPRSELRCFRKAECAEAEKLLGILNRKLESPTLRLEDYSPHFEHSKKIRQRHYEVWFGSGNIVVAR